MSDGEDFSANSENTVSGFGRDSHIENPNGFEDGSQPDSKNNPTVDNQGVTYSDVAPHKLVGNNKTSQYSDSSSLSANKSSMADAVGDREQKKKDEKDENEKEGKEDKLNEQEQSSSAVDNDPSLEVSELDASGEIWGTLSESVDQVEDGVQAAEATTSSSSILGWTAAIAAVGAGIAASSGGDNSAPEAPSLSLDDDTGLDGDGISSVAVISVSGLTQSASWEYSLDGGSSWQAGQGSNFTIDVDGDYSLLARQSTGSQTSDASNALAITLDTASPTLGDNLSLVIDESSGANQVIFTAAADADGTSDTSFSLADGSDVALSIDADSGAVTLSTDPDHETQDSYSFTVVATDAAGNVSKGQKVDLSVVDLDEVGPVITSGATASAIDENSGAAQVIYTAIADDSADISGGVSLSLAGGSDAALSLDAETGVVTLSTDPDHETQDSYSFTVVATDAAGNASEQAVTMGVNNLDEIAPSLVSNEGKVIDENGGANQVVYTITADDSGDISDGVSFSLTNDSDSALSVDASTGDVYLSRNPNYEGQSSYQFTAIATDAAGNVSANQTVSISILNVDEVAPFITSRSSANAISENSGASQVVYVATADDSLDVSNGVAFSLSESSDQGLIIDSETGEVTLNNNPDYESQDSYSFTVVATDAAGNASFGKNVTLAISNLDDSTPLITSAVSAAPVNENSGAAQVIYTATADDSADISGGVGFSLAGGSDAALSIDAETGVVILSTDPDHETQDSYSFTVVTTDAAGNASEQAVTMGVNDLDEVAPTIASGATATAIDENSGADQVIYTATADDSADVSGGVTFSLAEGSDAALSIDTASGAVTLSTDPDHEAQDAYSFTVVATDAAGNVSEQAVMMGVNDLDEIAPSITSGDAAAAIDENSGADQVIYTATADDSADVSGGVTFSLAEDSDAVLSVDPDTGVVTLTTDPDHETQSAYNFTVVATDAAGNAREQAVTLGINDLDDTAPVITSGDTAPAIDENSGANQVIYTVTSDDSADVSSGVTTYSLAAGSDTALSINASTGAVTMSSDPDHETQDSYSFTVVATDAAGNVSEQAVTMGVNDLDEVAPTIASGATATAIDENSGADQVIYTATADDSADVSGGVTFSLAEDSDAALSVDADTGVVTLSTDPDHEAQDAYSFTVVATDAAGNVSEQAVTMGVNDLDEVSPTITSANAELVVHNSGAGRIVYQATSTDSSDVSEGVSYSLSADSDPALTIDSLSGQVVLLDDPDSDTQSQYLFTVIVTDESGLTDTLSVTLDVDVAPLFTSADEFSVDENIVDGVVLAQVEAVDTVNSDAVISYSLGKTSDTAVSIDALTGEITFNKETDYESQDSYFAEVIATDENGNVSKQPITLIINDLDEVAPSITSGDIATVVDENSGADQVIYTATADDSADVSGGVTFSLAEDSDAALSIDAATGAVTLSTDPDHETQSAYNFTVVAIDAAGNAREQAVTLGINDLDDTAPVITSGDTAPAIDENSGAAQVIYTATADDSVDVSGGVTFSLAEDSDAALSIDTATGVVTLSTDPDHEAQDAYSFTVVATDAAGNASEQAVTLGINDLDDTAPVITSGDTAPAIDENSGANQVIYTVTSDDSVDVSSGVTTYSLAAGSDAALSINASTGAVTLSSDPDHETQDSYSFTVVATDAAGNVSEQAVTMGVNDLDEVAPSITSGAVASAIDENSGANQVVYTVTSDDSADVSDGVTTYSLADGSDDALSIDGDTGAVSLATDPDHETQSSYSFTVVATDAAGNVSEGQAVTLSVNDLDEVAPSITSGAVASAVDENSGANQVVYTVTSDDSADVSDGVTTYSLADGSDDALSIDGDTGAVSLATDPDHETQSAYSFTVVATDAAGNVSEGQAVTLSVNDLDEVAPSITSGAVASAIDENSGANQVVYTVTSDDSADVSDGVTTYSLADGSDDALSIDGDTGAVSLATDPDHETQSSYSFTVLATDAAGNASGGQAVTLSVNDLDDTAPVIDSESSVSVSDFREVLYSASADDSADISDGVTYSLGSKSSDDLTIDSASGEVRLVGSVTNYSSIDSYTFTVLATDFAGNSSQKEVSVSVTEPVSIEGPGVVSTGALVPTLTRNDAGALELAISLNDSLLDGYANGVGNYEFSVKYDVSDLGAIGDNQLSWPSDVNLGLPNTTQDGEVFFGGLSLFGASVDQPLLTITFPQTEIISATLEFTKVAVGLDQLQSSSYVISSFANPLFQGTDDSESFLLNGGEAIVAGGAGPDVFVLNQNSGSSITISDFSGGEDTIELSSLATSYGYQDIGGGSQPATDDILIKYDVGSQDDIAALIQSNDSALDNVFGAFLIEGDDGSDVLTVFIDASSDAGEVDIETYELTLPDDSKADDDDVTVSSYSFIA